MQRTLLKLPLTHPVIHHVGPTRLFFLECNGEHPDPTVRRTESNIVRYEGHQNGSHTYQLPTTTPSIIGTETEVRSASISPSHDETRIVVDQVMSTMSL